MGSEKSFEQRNSRQTCFVSGCLHEVYYLFTYLLWPDVDVFFCINCQTFIAEFQMSVLIQDTHLKQTSTKMKKKS